MSGGLYAYAREVALRIAERPGATASELYRLFGDRFHEWGYDGGRAATVIAQHLAELEQSGLVISEKTGKGRFDPMRWTWTGPAPVQTANEITAPQAAEQKTEMRDAIDEAISCGVLEEVTAQPEEIPADDAIRVVLLDQADDLDRALIAIRQTARAMARTPIDRRDEKIACLERLAEITAPDIAELLREIAEDIR